MAKLFQEAEQSEEDEDFEMEITKEDEQSSPIHGDTAGQVVASNVDLDDMSKKMGKKLGKFSKFFTGSEETGDAQTAEATSSSTVDPATAMKKFGKSFKKGTAKLAKEATKIAAELAESSRSTITVSRYLPMIVKDCPVLILQQGSEYKVENAHLDMQGVRYGDRLAYRLSKDMADKDEGRGAWWGESVLGIEEGDGWLKVDIQIENTAKSESAMSAVSYLG